MIHSARRSFLTQTFAIVAIATCLAIVSAENTHAGLLTSADEAQLEAWLGGGDRVFTKIYTKAAGHTAADFHTAADGKGPTISLMQIASVEGSTSDPDVGQIIGGFNPQSWSSVDGWHNTPIDADRIAFIFNLSANIRLDQRLGLNGADAFGQYQTNNDASYGPTFGAAWDLVTANDLTVGRLGQATYGPPVGSRSDGVYGENLLGDSYASHRPNAISGITDVTYGQIEVFTFSDVQPTGNMVPEPTSLAVFGVMGLVGCLRRRRRIV